MDQVKSQIDQAAMDGKEEETQHIADEGLAKKKGQEDQQQENYGDILNDQIKANENKMQLHVQASTLHNQTTVELAAVAQGHKRELERQKDKVHNPKYRRQTLRTNQMIALDEQ